MKIYRQGDVLLVQVKALPKGANEIERKGDLILAHGEVTGHAHRVKCTKVREWSAAAERFIQVMEAASVTHEEHISVALPPGIYRVAIQTEYTPAELRRVAD